MKIGKALTKVLDELEIMGITERKLLNHLKQYRDELKMQKDKDKLQEIQFKSHINNLIFGGRFYINNPTKELLHYMSNLQSTYNNKVLYYMLTRILEDGYFYQGKIYNMDDNGKCRFVIYLLKNNQDRYIEDYNEINTVYFDTNLEYKEDE